MKNVLDDFFVLYIVISKCKTKTKLLLLFTRRSSRALAFPSDNMVSLSKFRRPKLNKLLVVLPKIKFSFYYSHTENLK